MDIKNVREFQIKHGKMYAYIESSDYGLCISLSGYLNPTYIFCKDIHVQIVQFSSKQIAEEFIESRRSNWDSITRVYPMEDTDHDQG